MWQSGTMLATTAILQMAGAFTFATLSACLFHRDVRTGRRALDLAVLLVIFLGVQSLHVMIAGLCGLLSGFWLGASSFAGIIAFALVPRLRRRIGECLRGLVLPTARDLAAASRRNPVLATCAMAVAAYVAFHAFLFVVLAPPLTFDALTYHLSKVAQWIHSGSLFLPDLPVKRVFWPSGMELLNCWWAVFPHDELLIETPGLFFQALATLAIYVLAQNMGIRNRPAAWSALAFAITPAIVGHGSSCLTDLPTAALFFMLLALWTVERMDEASAIRRWILSAVVLLFAIGVKPTIMFMLPGAIVSAAPFLRRRDLTALASIRKIAPSLLVLAAGALFLGSFWYLRNTVRFGNPLYPVVAGSATEDGIQSGAFSLRNLKLALEMLVAHGGILDGAPIVPNLCRMTGWGWFAVACGIPCSVFYALKSRRFAFLLAGQIVAALTVLGFVLADFSCLRFLLWLPGPLAVGVAGAVSRGGLPKPIAAALALAAAMASFLNLFTGLSNAPNIDWTKQILAIGKRPGIRGASQQRIALFVPDNEDIAVFMWREGPLYIAYGPRFTRQPFTIEAHDGDVDFAGELDAAGLRFLFYPDFPRTFPLAAAALRRQIDAGLMRDMGCYLFSRVPPEPDSHASMEKEQSQ